MTYQKRSFSNYADQSAMRNLSCLLESVQNPQQYQKAMLNLGEALGSALLNQISSKSDAEVGGGCLIVSTAEDADFLAEGIRSVVAAKAPVKSAVFWNNHYALPNGKSVAPVVHKFLQDGYETCTNMVVVKSVISGSCVVRTNIMALIESVEVERIFIASPVMHKTAEASLRKEFPQEICDKFVFVYFALDEEKADNGEVIPGIGGQIYQLLGMKDQPARTSFMPKIVEDLVFGVANPA